MGFLVVAGAAIASTIASAVTAIVSFIIAIGAWLVTTIWSVLATIGHILAGITVGTLQGLGIVSGETAGKLLLFSTNLSTISITAYSHTYAFLTAVTGALSSFLEFIHFNEILKIHEIAYIVSSDYRRFTYNFYNKISHVSHAISGYAYFLTHALNNARTVVLDTSSMLGRPYDLGELTWLEELKGFLAVVESKANLYAQDPNWLFNDINEKLLRPAYNVQAEVWQGIYSTLENTLTIVDDTIQDVVKIRDDVTKLVAELPESIREDIMPYVESVTGHFDEFLAEKYHPTVDKLQIVLGNLEDNATKARDDMDQIVDRLRRPAQYLLEGDKLSLHDRLKDAEIYADLSSRIYRQPIEAWRDNVNSLDMSLSKIQELLSKPRALPQWDAGELQPGEKLAAKEDTGIKTPFPGDY